jgi:hypothetical protein
MLIWSRSVSFCRGRRPAKSGFPLAPFGATDF